MSNMTGDPDYFLPRGRSSNYTGPTAQSVPAGHYLVIPEGASYTQANLYAVTVTVQDGERTVTRRYEASTAEEAKSMAGECDLVANPVTVNGGG